MSPFFLAMIPNVPRHKMWLSVTEIFIPVKVWYLDSLWYFYDAFHRYWDSKSACREKMPFSWNGVNSITVFKRDRRDQIPKKELKTNRKTKCYQFCWRPWAATSKNTENAEELAARPLRILRILKAPKNAEKLGPRHAGCEGQGSKWTRCSWWVSRLKLECFIAKRFKPRKVSPLVFDKD